MRFHLFDFTKRALEKKNLQTFFAKFLLTFSRNACAILSSPSTTRPRPSNARMASNVSASRVAPQPPNAEATIALIKKQYWLDEIVKCVECSEKHPRKDLRRDVWGVAEQRAKRSRFATQRILFAEIASITLANHHLRIRKV